MKRRLGGPNHVGGCFLDTQQDGQVGESPWLLCLALFRTRLGEEAGDEESRCVLMEGLKTRLI